MLQKYRGWFFILLKNLSSLKMFFFTRISAILVLIFLSYAAISCPSCVQGTDFAASIYTAGTMVRDGKASDLYFDPRVTNFDNLPFNQYAHKLLPEMSAAAVTIFLYPPLLALLAQPLSYLSPQLAFMLWQFCSMLAVLICSILISPSSNKNWASYFFCSFLFAPVFQLLFAGQLDLIVVLLPMALGYYLLLKGEPLKAGLVLSLVLLKPQFLPIVLLLAAAQALIRRWQSAMGFAAGAVIFIGANIMCFGQQVAYKWFLALIKAGLLEDRLYARGSYMVASVPMTILERLPQDFKSIGQGIVYFLIVAIFIHAIFVCIKLQKKANGRNIVGVTLILGILVLPLIARHLLFYNLSIFLIGGMIIFTDPLLNTNKKLVRDTIIAWGLIDLYLIGFGFAHTQFIASPFLMVILIWLYIRAVNHLQRSAEKNISI